MGKGANRGAAALLALAAGCSFGVGGSISQIIVGLGYQVMHVVIGQTVAATVILGIITLARYRTSIPFKAVIQLAVIGILNLISSITYFFAIDLLSVGTTVAIQFQYVWIVVVFQAIAARRLPGKWTILSSAIIIVGTLFGSGMLDEMLAGGITMNSTGLVLALLCAVCYAAFIFLNSRIAVEYAAVPRSFYQVLGALIALLIILPFMHVDSCDVIGLVSWGILMGLLMGVLPIVFIVAASSNLPSGLVSILTSSELPMAVVAGHIILGETVTPLIVLGVVLICGSIALAQLDNRKA